MDFIARFAAWTGALASLSAAFWIFRPAPRESLVYYAVLLSERSGWLELPALAAAAIAGWNYSRTGSRWDLLPIAPALAAAVLALLPILSAARIAASQGIRLSPASFFIQSSAVPSSTDSVDTRTYAEVNGEPLRVDIYRGTRRGAAPARALLVLHGGAWRGGHRGELRPLNLWLAEQGFAVFAIDYRLAPQPNWPGALEDIRCAMGWVSDHAAEYGATSGEVILLGRSAGGHLALLAGYTAKDARFGSSCSAPMPRVSAVVAFYAPTDLTRAGDDSSVRDFLGGSAAALSEVYALASPVTHVTRDSPPTLLLHGQTDHSVAADHSIQLAERLAGAGAAHRLVLFPYRQHGFDFVDGASATLARQLAVQFIRPTTPAEQSSSSTTRYR